MSSYRTIQVVTPEVITKHWPSWKTAILASLPVWASRSEAVAHRVLDYLLDGRMQLWLMLREIDDKTQIAAVATTQIVVNQTSGMKTLEIFSLYGIGRPDLDDWRVCFDPVSDFARKAGCSIVVMQTQSERVVQIAEAIGFDTSIRLLTMGVD